MKDIGKQTVREIEELVKTTDDLSTLSALLAADPRRSVQKLRQTLMRRALRAEAERERVLQLYEPENMFYRQGIYEIAGIDEAGRGPVAGPVMIAAVILPPFWECAGLNDSKKIAPAKREALYEKIMQEAVAVSCIAKERAEIDVADIYHATRQGMYEAVQALAVPPKAVLVDAMPLSELTVPHRLLIHGDALSASIAAASIIAKVTRDRVMREYDKVYPQYGFAVHKGYLTQAHADAIRKFGPCPIHRHSFEPIKSIVGFHRAE